MTTTTRPTPIAIIAADAAVVRAWHSGAGSYADSSEYRLPNGGWRPLPGTIRVVGDGCSHIENDPEPGREEVAEAVSSLTLVIKWLPEGSQIRRGQAGWRRTRIKIWVLRRDQARASWAWELALWREYNGEDCYGGPTPGYKEGPEGEMQWG